MAATDENTLYVDFSHLLARDDVLARAIADQYYRFLPYLKRAVLNLVKNYYPEYAHLNSNKKATIDAGLQTRDFNIAFHNLPLVSSIRDLRTGSIGTLLAVSGTVTRTSEVRPELVFGTFVCGNCAGVVMDVEQQFKYTEPMICPNPTCGNRKSWTLKVDQCRFSDWQKVRVQENSSDIPTGSMPRRYAPPFMYLIHFAQLTFVYSNLKPGRDPSWRYRRARESRRQMRLHRHLHRRPRRLAARTSGRELRDAA